MTEKSKEKYPEHNNGLAVNLAHLQTMVDAANENGLFNDKQETHTSICSNIAVSFDAIHRDTKEAHEKFSRAYSDFNILVNKSSFFYRFSYCYGGIIVIYFVLVLLAIVLAWFKFQSSLFDTNVLGVPSWAILWGIIGGTFQGIWLLWQEINARRLRKHWLTWFFCIPAIGSFLGATIYLVYYTGLIISTGPNAQPSQSFGILLSALAGFSSLWAVKLLGSLTQMIQIKDPNNT